MFKHEPCTCPPESCLKGVPVPADCVNRLQGTVEAVQCAKCQGWTVHHNGECLKCQRELRDLRDSQITGPLPKRKVEDGSSLTLTITCGDKFVISDKKQVARILKILLEE